MGGWADEYGRSGVGGMMECGRRERDGEEGAERGGWSKMEESWSRV